MKTHYKIASSILFLAFTFLASYANAKCAVMINSLPYVIHSGNQTYCLGKDLNYNAIADKNLLGHYSIFDPANFWQDFPNINFTAAIVVAASGVTLDLNNHKLTASSLVPNQVAVAVYADDVSNFKLQNGTIKGFDAGAHISSTNSAVVNKIIFDQIKLKAIESYAPQKNIVTNNIVMRFSSAYRWPKAPVAMMYVDGASSVNDTITVTNNTITAALVTSGDPIPDDASQVWAVGIQIVSDKGIANLSNNTLTNMYVNNGVMAYFYVLNGAQITIRNNTLTFPINNPSSSLQNIAVLQSGMKLTQADSNSFSGFHTQFYAFNSGIPLIFSNNLFDLYRVNGIYPPLFYNYTNPSPINAGGNIIVHH